VKKEEKPSSVRILHNKDEIKHIICHLRMTLNRHDDRNYVALLGYKGLPITLIRKNDIYELFGVKRIFIPNDMGNLVKNNKGEIVDPTKYWLKWEEIPEWISVGLLENEYLDSTKTEIPPNKILSFFNEHYLVIRQPQLIHWKIREEYIKMANAKMYKSFMDNYGDKYQFGKDEKQKPTVEDFVIYMQHMAPSFGTVLIEPQFLTFLVKIDKVKQYITPNTVIHDSIKHLFENDTSSPKIKKSRKSAVMDSESK